MCPIPSGLRGTAIALYNSTVVCQDAFRPATRHVHTRVTKCSDVDGGIFEYVLY
jgi:hypothetical protein